MSCNHEKVYADYILTTNPPQYPWICKLCGETGKDYGLFYDNPYEDLKIKFKNINES